jgi:hypothetical protein
MAVLPAPRGDQYAAVVGGQGLDRLALKGTEAALEVEPRRSRVREHVTKLQVDPSLGQECDGSLLQPSRHPDVFEVLLIAADEAGVAEGGQAQLLAAMELRVVGAGQMPQVGQHPWREARPFDPDHASAHAVHEVGSLLAPPTRTAPARMAELLGPQHQGA